MLDKIPPENFEKIFHKIFKIVQRNKILEEYVFLDDNYLIPLAPEQIRNEDADPEKSADDYKQDCELNAPQKPMIRMLSKICKAHSKLKAIIVGDGLYSKQSFGNNPAVA